MNNQRAQLIGFYVLLGIVTVLVLMVWLPFLKLFALGAILSILFLPVHRAITKRTHNEAFAAWLTIIIILLIVIVPLYIFGQLLFNELVSLYGQFSQGTLSIDQGTIIHHLPQSLQDPASHLFANFAQKLSGFAGNAFNSVTNIISNIASFFIGCVLVFFTTFYLLKDGHKLKDYFNSVFPLSEEHENKLVSKLESAISGVIKGQFLVALSQGIVGVIGFFIFGVPQPFLWGAFTVLAALVPTFGTSLALIPAILYLFFTGHVGPGIGMAIWGAAAVGLIDNILAPRLISSRTSIHPLLVLFGVLGGISLFGYIGFLLGPILMSVFVALLDIYRTDLQEYLKK
jgi:predicted PurR-regulated permease PerM